MYDWLMAAVSRWLWIDMLSTTTGDIAMQIVGPPVLGNKHKAILVTIKYSVADKQLVCCVWQKAQIQQAAAADAAAGTMVCKW